MDTTVKPPQILSAVAESPAHFNGQRYFQPGIRTLRTPGEVWRWVVEGRRRPWPAQRPNRHHPALPPTLPEGALGIAMIGHATLLIQAGGLRCLTDPVFSPCAGPAGRLGPRRVQAPGLALAQLPPIDLVLLSHDHYDHLDLPSLQWLHRHHRVTVVCGLGHKTLLQRAGIDRVIELDWWQGFQYDGQTTVHFVPAQHWCGRSLHDRNLRLWGGLYLRTPVGAVYFAGDTGYGPHFKDIRRHLGAPDLALLPIGAYAPRWFMSANHMNPADAVTAHLDLGTYRTIPIHYGIFRLSEEGIDEPLEELERARRQAGLSEEALHILDVGDSWVLSPKVKPVTAMAAAAGPGLAAPIPGGLRLDPQTA